MNIRLVSAAAALVLSLGATSAFAQNVQTFDAWGHTFNVPGTQVVIAPQGVSSTYDAVTTGSMSTHRSHRGSAVVR